VADTTLEIGRDYPPDGEAAVIEQLRALHLMVQKVQPGSSLRGEHPKQHAGVWATFTIADQIPDAARVGLFAAPGSYKALIRFSNGRGPDDTRPDVHGMAIKVLVPEGAAPPRMQDFIVADHAVFFARDAQEVLDFLAATVKGVPIQELIPKYPKLVGFTNVPTSSLTAMTYWSQTPYRLGHGAVKYLVAPSAGAAAAASQIGASPDGLREALVDQLTTRKVGARFDFSVIPQTDAVTMPVEDPTVEWTSAPIRMATIAIDPQTFNSPEQSAFFANLSWTPWNALPAHQPLGGINRARRHVYGDSAALRHETTGTGPVIPSLTEFRG
jgi:hypothetical protein